MRESTAAAYRSRTARTIRSQGLPPITPSMPSFTFLPQPSPAAPPPMDQTASRANAAAAAAQGQSHGHAPTGYDAGRAMLHGHGHVMSPFSPFSPGVTMSPGAFWGRPGSGAVNPCINPAVGAPVHAHPMPGSPGGYYSARTGGRGEAGAEEPQGYFPPVPVSMAMAQGQAQTQGAEGYFPPVPPSGSTGPARSSGLANEIRRGDSGSNSGSASASADAGASEASTDRPEAHGRGRRPEQPRVDSSNSGATTDTGTGTDASPRPPSSEGTSWHTDDKAHAKRVGGVCDAVEGMEALAVADGEHGVPDSSGSAKPRPFSDDAQQQQQQQGTSSHPKMQRADSDPVRSGSDVSKVGLGINMPGSGNSR
ncbi:predicted protein [Postia placenta Mad-698-R]|nr:predicted protein [Postia placenta Mad-698-R]